MPLSLLHDSTDRRNDLKQMLHEQSAPAAPELVKPREGGAVQCFACGHRCLVKPGRDGVCRVRFNHEGTLLVPYGYVGALACDPIEKKPFFHVLPGNDVLTFGMLGCDFHCGYCFTGDTTVVTHRGPATLADLFAAAPRVLNNPDGDVAFPVGLKAIAASGKLREVRGIFRHPYRGRLSVIQPYYLPQIRCTPDHRVYATTDANVPPSPIRAAELTTRHLLAVPRRYPDFDQWSREEKTGTADSAEQPAMHDVAALLGDPRATHHVRWKLSPADRERIAVATAAGETSAQIGAAIGKSASYVRHVRVKLKDGKGLDFKVNEPLVENGTVRFPHERRPAIPASIPLDEDFAALLGYYCAEGCVVRSKSRPNSLVLNFSFSLNESALAEKVSDLLRRCIGVSPRRVRRRTTEAVVFSKASAALVFKTLAGGRGMSKRVPEVITRGPESIVRAFLNAYVEGDGHRYQNGKVSVTTVSHDLAYGVAWLVLRLGYLPSVYDQAMEGTCVIEGRRVRRSPHQYSVVWYESPLAEGALVRRAVIERDDFYLIPIRESTSVEYDGPVYNMEVDEEHNYLANFQLVANCQNWVTSQMLRDPHAAAAPQHVTPDRLVERAIQLGAPMVASSYNEPLITSEWAVAVFKEAQQRGLKCAYISNGNGTPEVLDYIRPYVPAYKVDLKTFSDRHYRQLGGVLENVLNTIKMLKERDFWVEIVTLMIPSFSDDRDELKRMADFLASVDPLMPWHITAFHPDYKMTEGYRRTRADELLEAVEIGREAGLRYLYPGNLPGMVGQWEDTRCHHCDATLIRRTGFQVHQNRVGADGKCPECKGQIPGIWR